MGVYKAGVKSEKKGIDLKNESEVINAPPTDPRTMPAIRMKAQRKVLYDDHNPLVLTGGGLIQVPPGNTSTPANTSTPRVFRFKLIYIFNTSTPTFVYVFLSRWCRLSALKNPMKNSSKKKKFQKKKNFPMKNSSLEKNNISVNN